MRKIEALLSLPKPEFEYGNKNVANVALRRALALPQLRENGDRLINQAVAPIRSPQVRELKRHAETSLHSEDRIRNEGLDLIRRNLLFLPTTVHLRASPFHLDHWTRDSFISTLILNNPPLEKTLLDDLVNTRIDRFQVPQVPTVKLIGGNRAWFFDDESTMLAIVWRGKIAANGEPLTGKEKAEWKDRLDWVRPHAYSGTYLTHRGTEKSWFDTFAFGQDIITFNQGILPITLISAGRMGLNVSAEEISEAIEGYQSLTHPSGRLQLSAEHPYKDVSSLFGEFLSNELLGESVLPDDIVKATVESFPMLPQGFPVVVNEDDSYLSPDEFNTPYTGGHYQNGAEWPAWSAAAVRVAENHGVNICHGTYWDEVLKRLRSVRNSEYIITGDPTTALPYNPERVHHTWNSLVYHLASKKQ